MQIFKPLTFPLDGRRLIEASAGTGKTYSIALLYLRFILERKIEIDRILVVTFTTSATEELRDRIRSRLREALDILEGRHCACDREDATLVGLLLAIDDWEEARVLLTDALVAMDESAIFTIHGFCQRMLQDNAFESGIPFEVDFLESEQHLRRSIMDDFWRQRFYAVSPGEAEWVAGQWQDPGVLLKSLAGILSRQHAVLLPDVTDGELVALRTEAERCLAEARDAWVQSGDQVKEILENDKWLKRDKQTAYGDERIASALEGMQYLAGTEEMAWVLPRCVELLASSVMAGLLKKGAGSVPAHPFFDLFDAFYTVHGEFIRFYRVRVLQAAWDFLRHELKVRKSGQAKMYFDDLLSFLDSALARDETGELVNRVRSRFVIALVDEFQDTDSVQYRIFQKLFGTGTNPGLVMIGDPKQAIYSFRGADVFTYINAKHETPVAGRFTMGSNYRSAAAMVEAVNRLFDKRGSFVFDREIPFEPVAAAGRADDIPLLIDGIPPVPLTAMILPEKMLASGARPIAKNRAERPAARWCAAEINTLVAKGLRGTATLGDSPVSAGDVAVLVRTHREADMIQEALRERGIASVYYSRDSVFETEEARQMVQVLSALVDPGDEPQIRSALATDLFGLDAGNLDGLAHDELRWAGWLRTFLNYQECLQKRGFAAMLQELLHDQRVVYRLSSRSGGERQLTNFLHLTELLQNAANEEQGMEGLLRWLIEQRSDPEADAASQQLRLESDEDLVKIVTVHKAKGLEYAIVFLPFLWSCRVVNKKEIFSFHEREKYGFTADFGTGEERFYRLAEEERLAEDLRLLYVAVTRARYCCYFCWGRINAMDMTALAWLLHRNNENIIPSLSDLNEERISRDIEKLNGASQIIRLLAWPDLFAAPAVAAKENAVYLAAKVFKGKINTSWQVTSYSQMVSGHDAYQARLDHERAGSVQEPFDDGTLSVFTFPRGAAAGTFLHELFEQLDFPETGGSALEDLVDDRMRRAGLPMQWRPVVCRWIEDILDSRLDSENYLTLRRIRTPDRLVEMGFYFSVEDLDSERFNRILAGWQMKPVSLPVKRLQGLLKGFVDLIFRYEGRYYIADYKSNYLGPDFHAYSPGILDQVMAEHRYDLQYLIYCVALHRYLGSRMAGYDYDTSIGGVYYLFLRGMHPAAETGSGVFFTRPPRELVEELDCCFLGQE